MVLSSSKSSSRNCRTVVTAGTFKGVLGSSDSGNESPSFRLFREELLLLNKTIMRFVNNPVFQAANSVDVNLAKKASDDLDQVISLTLDLKQNAQKLRKTGQ